MVSRSDSEQPFDLAAVRRATLGQVAMSHRIAEAAAANRIQTIMTARTFGATWEELGTVMGMTRQAANKRFAQHVDDSVVGPAA